MTFPNRSEVLSIVNSIIGLELTSIHLIVYEYKQKILEAGAFLELAFRNGSFLCFSPAGDGDSVSVIPDPWDDPFTGDISPINRDFLETHGQYKRKNVSLVEPYKKMINHVVKNITPIDKFGKLVGVSIFDDGYCLSFLVEGDEGHISCEPFKK